MKGLLGYLPAPRVADDGAAGWGGTGRQERRAGAADPRAPEGVGGVGRGGAAAGVGGHPAAG